MTQVSNVLLMPSLPNNGSYNNGGGKPPRGPRIVSQLTDEELRNLLKNFQRKGVIVSPHYKLKEVKYELFHRQMKCMDGELIARTIVKLAAASHDNLVSYADLYIALFGAKFKGRGAIPKIMNALGSALLHCLRVGLPVLTTLICRKDRTLAAKAKLNIVDAVTYLDGEIGVDAEQFIASQMTAAKALIRDHVNSISK